MRSKIQSQKKLSKTIARLKRRGKKIVFTNGCFDLLHLGHVKYLEKARGCGNILVVALNSDSSVRAIKGAGRPLTKQLDRAKVIAALEAVDFVTVFNEKDPLKVIKKLKPSILVKGADWARGMIVGAEFVESLGGKVKRIPYIKGYSTSGLIRKIGQKS